MTASWGLGTATPHTPDGEGFWSVATYDEVFQVLQQRKIGAMVNYRAIHRLTWFRETYGFRGGEFPIAERIGDETLSLPFYPRMPHEHVEVVARTLAEVLR